MRQRTRSLGAAVYVGALLFFALSVAAAAADTDHNPSATAGSSASDRANAMADRASYQDIKYVNANKPGPRLIVLDGQIRTANPTFLNAEHPNNIADFAEVELLKANFNVLERRQLQALLGEFNTAYSLGDPNLARRTLEKGKVASTRWVVRFDILRAEPIAKASSGFSGNKLSSTLGSLFNKVPSQAQASVASMQSQNTSEVWIVGMRYTIIDATTTEQVASKYLEDKMELGASSSTAVGISNSAQGGATLDTLVTRLIQQSVADIDANHK